VATVYAKTVYSRTDLSPKIMKAGKIEEKSADFVKENSA